MASLFKFFLKIWPFTKGKQTLAHYIYNIFFKRSSQVKNISIGDIHYSLKLSDRIQCIFFLTGLYEPETVKISAKLGLTPPSIYLDVGANVGLIALQLKSKIPNMELHLFEADPHVFKQLQKNVNLNNLKDVHLNQNAVSEVSHQELVFHPSHQSDESGWGRLENNENMHLTSNIKVKSLSLDDYLREKNISTVQVLKIDVEGAEESVFLGAKNALNAKVFKNIICEMNEESLKAFGSSTKGLKELLEKYGYKRIKNVDMNALFQPHL